MFVSVCASISFFCVLTNKMFAPMYLTYLSVPDKVTVIMTVKKAPGAIL